MDIVGARPLLRIFSFGGGGEFGLTLNLKIILINVSTHEIKNSNFLIFRIFQLI